jgi:hypothetical protein
LWKSIEQNPADRVREDDFVLDDGDGGNFNGDVG